MQIVRIRIAIQLDSSENYIAENTESDTIRNSLNKNKIEQRTTIVYYFSHKIFYLINQIKPNSEKGLGGTFACQDRQINLKDPI